jgi:hypothetical protein
VVARRGAPCFHGGVPLRRSRRRTAAALVASAALAAWLAPAPGGARPPAEEVAVEVLEHAGACTGAVVRKADLTRRCAPFLIQARYEDGHTSWLFAIEGAATVTFHGTRDFRREPGTHVVLVDRLRVRQESLDAPGFCLITGRFGHPTRLVYAGPVSIRCRAGTLAAGDLADLRFQSSGAPASRNPNGP